MGQHIIQQLREDLHYQPKVPYPPRKDGDLWAIFHANVKARGPSSIELVKVKGHAADAGITTEQQARDKHGNDNADELAKTARTRLHDSALLQLSDYIAARAQQYIAFLKATHDIIFCLHIAKQKARNSLADTMQSQHNQENKCSISCPFLPQQDDIRATSLHVRSQQCYSWFPAAQPSNWPRTDLDRVVHACTCTCRYTTTASHCNATGQHY